MFKELQRTRIQNRQFAAYIYNTPMTLKQNQGHQTWHKLSEPKQGYNHPMFKRPNLSTVHQKANTKVFVKSENMSIISIK